METITIEKMTYGIDSLGHIDGKVVFIPYGAPQDRAEVEIRENKNDYLRGELVKVIDPSPQRQKSPCPHFPECGGCHWLHIHPETQRREKEAYLNFLMKPLAPTNVYPIEPLSIKGYRNKIDLKLQLSPDGKLSLGNYKFRSYDVIDIPDCYVQCPSNMKIYQATKIFLEEKIEKAKTPQIKQIATRTLGNQQHMMVYLNEAPDDPTTDKWREFFNQTETLSKLELLNENMCFLTLVREKEAFSFMKKTWMVSPRSFFQNNLEGAEAIYYTLMSIYDNISQKGKFIDLYCGVGIQTMLLENHFEEVFGIECNEDSYRDALRNQKGRRTSSIRFLCRRAETIFGTPITKGVIAALHMNPPRTGISPRVMKGLMGVKPRMITYLSCNPMTFKRDAQGIVNMGYKLEQVYAFDLFPGTFHLEILGVFGR